MFNYKHIKIIMGMFKTENNKRNHNSETAFLWFFINIFIKIVLMCFPFWYNDFTSSNKILVTMPHIPNLDPLKVIHAMDGLQ